MSRVGKQPLAIPNGVQASVQGDTISIKGPKGAMSYTLGRGVSVESKDGKLIFAPLSDDKQSRANWGTARARVDNMVEGVTKGWKRVLEMNGVGYNPKVSGQLLTLTCGFSHEVKIDVPKEVRVAVNKTTIDLESADRELLGTLAANIRKVQPPEPYLGKGIKYAEEKIRRKAGKTGKK